MKKKQERIFLDILLGTSDTSILGNILNGKRVIRTGIA